MDKVRCPHCDGEVEVSAAKLMGQKGGAATAAKHGSDYFREIGKRGGEATKANQGPGYYERIGTKGGQKVKELIRKAKG